MESGAPGKFDSAAAAAGKRKNLSFNQFQAKKIEKDNERILKSLIDIQVGKTIHLKIPSLNIFIHLGAYSYIFLLPKSCYQSYTFGSDCRYETPSLSPRSRP